MRGLLKGIVMDVKNGKVYLLAEGGAFYRIPWRGAVPEVGDEVFVRPPSRLETMSRWARSAMVACLAIFLFISSAAVSYHYAPRAAAYVSVDINPSIELLLSTADRVMEARPLNADGARILDEVHLLGIPGERAVEIITRKAAQDGYLHADRYNIVLITVTPLKGKEIGKDLEQRLVGEARSVLNDRHLEGTAEGIETTPEVRHRAEKLGLSPGRYAILVESLNSELKILPENLKEKSISEVLEEAGGNVSSILNSVTEGILEDKEDALQNRLEQQSDQEGNSDLNLLLNDLLSPVTGITDSLLSSDSRGEAEGAGEGGGTGPLPDGVYRETLTEAGGEEGLLLEKTLAPVKDNLLDPISDNILAPLARLLNLGEKEGD